MKTMFPNGCAWAMGACLLLPMAGAAEDGGAEQMARRAVEKALPYLADEGEIWIEERKCASCHHTGLLIWGHRLAGERGFAIDAGRFDKWSEWMRKHELASRTDEEGRAREGINADGDLEGTGQWLLGGGARAGGGERGAQDDALQTFHASFVAAQKPEGFWKAGGQLPFQKRPAQETDAVSTAWATLALDAVPGSDRGARGRALRWLATTAPEDGESTEYSAVRVLLADRFQGAAETAGAVIDLLHRRNKDGGWPWLKGGESDALATGQALYALAEIGRDQVEESVIRAAWKFLATSQRDDGSWRVLSTKEKKKTRSTEISNFFGSAWAVIGICRSLPEK